MNRVKTAIHKTNKGAHMIYSFIQCNSRKYLRRNKITKTEEVVSVSNRNNLSVEKHMELLNANDDKYEYVKYLGGVETEN